MFPLAEIEVRKFLVRLMLGEPLFESIAATVIVVLMVLLLRDVIWTLQREVVEEIDSTLEFFCKTYRFESIMLFAAAKRFCSFCFRIVESLMFELRLWREARVFIKVFIMDSSNGVE